MSKMLEKKMFIKKKGWRKYIALLHCLTQDVQCANLRYKSGTLLEFLLNVSYFNFCYRKCQCNNEAKECKARKLCKSEDDCGKHGACILPDFGETKTLKQRRPKTAPSSFLGETGAPA